MFVNQSRMRVILAMSWVMFIGVAGFSLYEKYNRIADCHALQGRQDILEKQTDDQAAELEGMLGKLRQ